MPMPTPNAPSFFELQLQGQQQCDNSEQGVDGVGSQIEIDVHEVHRVFEAIRNEVHTQLRASIRRQSAGTCVESEADDIAQVVFILLWQALKSGSLKDLTLENWNTPENLFRIRTTVFRTARFVRYRFYRRTSRLRTNVEDFSSQYSQVADMQLFEEDMRLAMQKCLKETQEAFFLRSEGMSYPEIAGHQGVTSNVARLRYFRARAVLKKWLSDIG